MPSAQQSGTGAVTLGEVNRNLMDLRDVVQNFVNEVRDTTVRRETYVANEKARDIYVAGIEARVVKLEGTNSWLLRTLGGAVIVALVGIFFTLSHWIGS